MDDMFITDKVRQEIAKDFFVTLEDLNPDPDYEEAEHEFMKFASDDLKIKYNHFYRLTSGDEFFFEVTD
jgi:transposase-like protein